MCTRRRGVFFKSIKAEYSPSWFNCWEINDATVKLNKLNLTLMQKQSQCVRTPISVQTMKSQVVIHPSQVIHIIMMDCERRWLGCRCLPLPPVFLGGQSDDELFFCSLAQRDTFSSPDGPHRDSLSRLVCCLVASAGRWNITHTSELSLTWRTPAATNKILELGAFFLLQRAFMKWF